METKVNLAKAIIAVMQEVKGIEKSMTIGTGNSSYKGVPDQEVKKIIGESMAKHGLCILPIAVEPKIQIDRWEETAFDNYQKKEVTKQKQSVFTEVTTKYLLLHSSGESIELSGYGHGIDSQDKGAGKATTYALKYTMLYTFLVPTGKIDDADNTHSDSIQTPIQTPKPSLTEQVETAKAKIITATTLDDLKAKWSTLNKIEQAFQEVIELKDKLKTTLK
jgi:hypothetical protein